MCRNFTPSVSFLKISGEGRLLETVEEQEYSSSSLSELEITSDSRLSDVVLPDITGIFAHAVGKTPGLDFLEFGATDKTAMSSESPISAELRPCNVDDSQ